MPYKNVKAPKGCEIKSGHEKKKTAQEKAERYRKKGMKARVVERSKNGRKKYYVATCGKRKK